MLLRWIVFIAIYCILGYYSLQAIKTASRYPWMSFGFIAIALLILLNFIYQFTLGDVDGSVLSQPKSYAFGFLIAIFTFEIITIFFLFSEDIFRLISGIFQRIFGSSREFDFPARRRFLSLFAMGIAAVPFSALLYGMYKGKYDFRVLRYELEFDDLPEGFHNYQITQISDIHSGSFDDADKIAYAVNLINEQKSDAILFTGDMINNLASEMEPWKGLFTTLKAKDGKYSIFGNHDYADYSGLDDESKLLNIEQLKRIQREMGFDLLLNESRYLRKGSDKIALIGVENWGRGGFKKAGDLKKASEAVEDNDFKILLSHDPSHWEDVVLHDPVHYHLTLSGHTHGMQFGIEIPGWVKWSPIKWRYKYWAGIYEEKSQLINVNRGFGFLGYPGRVGIWPEITVITLKKKSVV